MRARGLQVRGHLNSISMTGDLSAKVRMLSVQGVIMDVAETRIVKLCLNPVWNAVFSFEIHHTEVCTSRAGLRLEISLDDNPNHSWGRASVPMSSLQHKQVKRWLNVSTGTVPFMNKEYDFGEIKLAARWMHSAVLQSSNVEFSAVENAPNELKIILVRARGLSLQEDVAKKGGPFVVRLNVGTEIRQSSPFKKSSLPPMWREAFAIPVHGCDAGRALLEVAIQSPGCDYFQVHAEVRLHVLLARKLAGVLRLQSWLSLVASTPKTHEPQKLFDYSPVGEIEMVLEWIHNPRLSFYDPIEDDSSTGVPNLLHVAVIQARGLRTLARYNEKTLFADHSVCDPYVLMKADGIKPICSSAVSQTLDPRWCEAFRLPFIDSCLQSRNVYDQKLILEVIYCIEGNQVQCELLGCCSVDIITELGHREVCRAWRTLYHSSKTLDYPSTCGEIEIEFRWVRDKSLIRCHPEPLYKLHFSDVNAAILRSRSDSVIEGAMRLGVHARVIKSAINVEGRYLADDHTTASLRLNVLRALLYGKRYQMKNPFVIIKLNNDEIQRVPSRFSTRRPDWVLSRLSSRGQVSILLSLDRPCQVSLEVWGAGTLSARENYLGEVPLTPNELFDCKLQGGECALRLNKDSPGHMPGYAGGSLILSWKCSSFCGSDSFRAMLQPRKDPKLNALRRPVKTALSGNMSDTAKFPHVIRISSTTVVGLRDIRSIPLNGLEQQLYIFASIGNDAVASRILGNVESEADQQEDVLDLPVRSVYWNSKTVEEMRVEVRFKPKNDEEICFGSCTIPLQAHWINDATQHHISQMLSRPDNHLRGHLCCKVEIIAQHSTQKVSTLEDLANDERRRVLSSLERSAEYAKRAGRDIIAIYPKACAKTLSAVASCQRDIIRANERLRVARGLDIAFFLKRAQSCLTGLCACTVFSARTRVATSYTSGCGESSQRPTSKLMLVKESPLLTVRHRQLAHVKRNVRFDPKKAIGVIWGVVRGGNR